MDEAIGTEASDVTEAEELLVEPTEGEAEPAQEGIDHGGKSSRQEGSEEEDYDSDSDSHSSSSSDSSSSDSESEEESEENAGKKASSSEDAAEINQEEETS